MSDRHEARFPVMGTTAHVTILGGSVGLVDAAQARLTDLERRWSRFVEDSELSQLNRSASGPVIVSAETFALIAGAVDAWRATDGRFDPTIAITMNHAGYDRPFAELTPDRPNRNTRHTPAPTPDGIALYPEASAVRLPPGVSLDLGGIAKGAAADLVTQELLEAGAAGCCVNIGGDLRMDGVAPQREGWRVRLDCPGSSDGVDIGVTRGAVCTSTTQKRRWLGRDGAEHHVRQPATGSPAAGGLCTVTVVSAYATQGEVLAKSALLAGGTEAADIIHQADATGVMVTDAGELMMLAGLQPFIAAAAKRAAV